MFHVGEGVDANGRYARQLYTLCATTEIVKVSGRESGFNNAVHECRRELGKLLATETTDNQKALRTAALWMTKSLSDQDDGGLDSEIGVRARRSRRVTTELLEDIKKKLEPASTRWIDEMLEKWESYRWNWYDRTAFPLTMTDEIDGGNHSSLVVTVVPGGEHMLEQRYVSAVLDRLFAPYRADSVTLD